MAEKLKITDDWGEPTEAELAEIAAAEESTRPENSRKLPDDFELPAFMKRLYSRANRTLVGEAPEPVSEPELPTDIINKPAEVLSKKRSTAELAQLREMYMMNPDAAAELDKELNQRIRSRYDLSDIKDRNAYQRALKMKVFLQNPTYNEISENTLRYRPLKNTTESKETKHSTEFLMNQAILNARLELLEIDFKDKNPREMTIAEKDRRTNAYRRKIDSYLKYLGYEKATNIFAAMQGRICDKRGDLDGQHLVQFKDDEDFYHHIDVEDVRSVLTEYNRQAYELGAENVQRLQNECGIINFDLYRTDQLKSQAKWLAGDKATLRELSSEDARVAITWADAVNDQNGAIATATKSYTSRYTHSLVFEFSGDAANEVAPAGQGSPSMTSLSTRNAASRYYNLINERNTHYTAVTIAAHGHESGHLIYLGDSYLTSELYSGQLRKELDDNFMPEKPILAIESGGFGRLLSSIATNNQDISRVYITSCHQGKPDGGIAEIVASFTHGERQAGKTIVTANRSEASDRLLDDGVTQGAGGRVLVHATGKSPTLSRFDKIDAEDVARNVDAVTYDSREAVISELMKNPQIQELRQQAVEGGFEEGIMDQLENIAKLWRQGLTYTPLERSWFDSQVNFDNHNKEMK